MVAAVDWCSHTTHEWIWLDSCLGFNGLLRLFQSISDCLPKREKEKIDEGENVPHLLQAQ